MKTLTYTLAALGAAITLGAAASATNITGAGSTFVYPVLSKWASDYKGMTGDQINYQSIGSGGGIAQIKAGTVDFGATDKPLAPSELAGAGLAQFPVAIGGVVPVVHLAGVRPGQMKLSGPVLAAIYDGEIKMWNDPHIQQMNPGVKLPAVQISTVHRSDASGTSFNFTHLSQPGQPALEERPPAKARRSSGRTASAARATRALRRTSTRSRIRSVTSNTLTCCRTT